MKPFIYKKCKVMSNESYNQYVVPFTNIHIFFSKKCSSRVILDRLKQAFQRNEKISPLQNLQVPLNSCDPDDRLNTPDCTPMLD